MKLEADIDKTCSEKIDENVERRFSKGVNLGAETMRTHFFQEHSYSKASKVNIRFKYITKHMPLSVSILTDAQVKFYTGLTKPVFEALLVLLKSDHQSNNKRQRHLTFEDQILLFLMRLRLGLLFADLGQRFSISRAKAGKIFNSWLPLVTSTLRVLVCWLPETVIKKTMPSSFRILYPNTTCIIDGTEMFTQRPLNLRARGQVYSNYKKHSTVKFLVGIAPNGYFMFVSKAYGGRASDKFTVTTSGFLDLMHPGMEIMADRGYTISAELGSRGVKLNVPAFCKSRKQFPTKEVIETRRIASVRIHVERAIARLKNFRILKYVFPLKSIRQIGNIVLCCAALSNLQPPLIKNTNSARMPILT